MKKPARAARKKPAGASTPKKKIAKRARGKTLDFADLGLGDLDEDGPPGLVDLGSDLETEDELAFGGMGFDDCAEDGGEDAADPSLDPPLIEVVRMLLARVPTNYLLQLVDNWRLLSHASKAKQMPVGSGCTGSGMDWVVVQAVSEAVPVSCCKWIND